MYKVFDTINDVSLYVAQRIVAQIKAKPTAVLGLATGSTMEPVYESLLQCLQQEPVDVSQLQTFNLDEYIGLGAAHAQSYSHYMQEHLFQQLGICEHNTHLPDGLACDSLSACEAYSAAIAAAGSLDFQLLGIGTNGHIGFNEPQVSFTCRTHVVELSQQTRSDNGRFFANHSEVPTHAITLGIQDILEAKEIVLVATGVAKAQIIADLFYSAVDERLPASALKQHANLTIVLDRAAAALLPGEVLQEAVVGLKAELQTMM